MLRLGTVRFRAKCPRHPRYNPLIEGEGAIKGGCPKCQLLLEIALAHRHMVGLMKKVKDASTSKRPDLAAADETQLSLFGAE